MLYRLPLPVHVLQTPYKVLQVAQCELQIKQTSQTHKSRCNIKMKKDRPNAYETYNSQ